MRPACLDRIARTLLLKSILYDVDVITNGENALDFIGQYDNPGFSPLVPSNTQNGFNNGPTRFGFSYPQSLALDSVHHRLFVADLDNGRVLVYNLDNSNKLTVKTPFAVLGRATFTSAVYYDATAAVLNSASGLGYDSANDRLFVSDQLQNRVLVFDTASIASGESAIAVFGQEDFTASSSGCSATTLDYPAGLALDAEHSLLYVADSGNKRLLAFDIEVISSGEAAIHVLGQPDFNTSNNPVTAASLHYPRALALDTTSRRLFVSDNATNRVLVFDVDTITNGEPASGFLCQDNFTSSDVGSSQSSANKTGTVK